MNAVVLSDVHIGDDSPTCWYQKKYHEPYLTSALNWVQSNASSISDLILLGDLVDFWTYTPERTPPTMSEIINANPNILGGNGALAKAAKAVIAAGGHVTLTPGNHDITLTSNDVSTLSAAIGAPIIFDQAQALRRAGAISGAVTSSCTATTSPCSTRLTRRRTWRRCPSATSSRGSSRGRWSTRC